MSTSETSLEYPVLGPDDPPVDFSREEAAYQRQRSRLVRDHLDQIALVHDDEVVGAFPTAGEAIREGVRRFGLVKMMLREIRDPDESEYIPHVDVNHPSFRSFD
jgi:hypothetical protein